MSIQHTLFALVFLLIAASSHAENCGRAEKRLAEYLQERTCKTAEAIGCLELSEDGGEALPVFYWKDGTETWGDKHGKVSKHYLPHFLRVYLHHLRNAYAACGTSKELLVWAQVQAIIADAKPRQAPGNMPSLVWENRYGYAQGMEQAEMAAYLASLAAVYQSHGENHKALSLMRDALRSIEALAIPISTNSGGVRSAIALPCGSGQNRVNSCFWFHSRGLGIDTANEDAIPTVLNQHLHVIHDVLLLYYQIHGGGIPMPPEYGTPIQVLERLESYALGGLAQLAFADGNSAKNPSAPPNMVQFLERRGNHNSSHYLAYYRFDLSKRAGRNIRWKNVCHYHTHSLVKLAHVRMLLDKYPEVYKTTASGQGNLLYSTINVLFAGGKEPMGAPHTKAPVWQLWQTQRAKYTIAQCPACGQDNCSPEDVSVDAYYGKLQWRQ